MKHLLHRILWAIHIRRYPVPGTVSECDAKMLQLGADGCTAPDNHCCS